MRKTQQHSDNNASEGEQLPSVNLNGIHAVKLKSKKLPKLFPKNVSLVSVTGSPNRLDSWNVRVFNAIRLRDAVRDNLSKRGARLVIAELTLTSLEKELKAIADHLGIPEEERGQL